MLNELNLQCTKTAMEDRIITSEERKLLKSLATAYVLSGDRVRELEAEFDARLEEE